MRAILARSVPRGRAHDDDEGVTRLGATLLVWGTCALAQADGIAMREASIPMPDGVKLAADLYLPREAGPTASPSFSIPPLSQDEIRGRDYRLYSYFVQRGYVVARVDIRGTGNSEGG